MKSLTDPAKTKIAITHGNEANVYIVVAWLGQTPVMYNADRILQVGNIDSAVSQDGRSTQSVTITLDDTSGDFKQKIDSSDTHQVQCSVYQQITGLDDDFLLFKGCIFTPLTWSEGDRTVSFNITSRLIDKDAGYTDIFNQFWPLCFGSPVYVPAAKIKKALTATLDDILCITDYSIEYKKSLVKKAYQDQQMIARYYRMIITGSNNLAPGVTVLIKVYCDLIRTHRNLILQVEAMLREIEKQKEIIRKVENGAGGNEVRAIRADNKIKELKAKIRKITGEATENDIENDKANALVALIQGKPVPQQGPAVLNTIGWMKLECERLIALALERYKIKKEAFKRILHCQSEMSKLASTYHQYEIEQCEQSLCNKRRVHIKQITNQPLTGTRFNIGGVLWPGTVDGEYLELGSPIAIYRDVAIKRWSSPVECDGKGWNNFWITDPTKRLAGMYCLVESNRDGSKHVIRVEEQDNDKCTFNLIAFDTNNKSSNLVQTPLPISNYNVPFGPIPGGIGVIIPGVNNSPQITLSPAIVARLDNTFLGPEEFYALAVLQQIEPQDYTNDQAIITLPRPSDIYTIVGWEVSKILEVAAIPLAHWFDGTILGVEYPDKFFWQVPQGTTIYQEDQFHEVYVCNILPSQIKSVKAYHSVKPNPSVDSLKVLTEVPTSLYSKNENEDVGPFNVTSIRFNTPLNMVGNGQWDDKIYVSLVSSKGPNVVDVLEYLILTYTEKTYDPTSFAAVKILQENYPVDFALLGSKNIYTLLHEIAWQARCAIYEINDVYYLKYLSKQGTPVATITESDIEVSTLELSCEDTENVVTKFVASWRPDYLDTTEEQYITLKFNTNIFDEREQKYDFYIYKHYGLVQKSATFWLIRLSNVWKEVTFNTFLTHINLEYLDTITLDFATAYFATSDVSAEIRDVNYDSITKTVKLKLWLPVRFGEMAPYPLAWPAEIDENILFPTVIDIEKNYVPIAVTVTEVQGQ